MPLKEVPMCAPGEVPKTAAKPDTQLVIYKMCGEAVAYINTHDLAGIITTYGDCVKALKLYLARTVGLSRFRQRLIDAEAQMVPCVRATDEDMQNTGSAAEKDTPRVMQELYCVNLWIPT